MDENATAGTLEFFHLLTDAQLLAEVAAVVARERHATTVVIASLCELEGRQLYRGQGYPSLYSYCTQVLHLSEHEAYSRIRAARAVRRFPTILDLLRDGSLTLTNLNLLAPHLTDDNHVAILHAARYKTRREIMEQIAALDPMAPNLITLVIRLPRETHDKWLHAQDLVLHTIPDGDTAQIFDRAITLLLNDLQRQKKIADVRQPRPAVQRQLTSRYIPSNVCRRVWRRDEGRCAFVGAQGRCPETGRLEFHHVISLARGGPTTVENIQLRCRAHNQYEAELEFGVGAANSRGP